VIPAVAPTESSTSVTDIRPGTTAPPPVWLTISEAAQRARCSPKLLYSEIRRGRLRAAVIGGRRSLRLRPEWVDQWLEASATPVEITRDARR
jgi:excisionase family DNA binding protein